MNAYLSLIENNYPLENKQEIPDQQTPLIQLLAYAHEHEILPSEGAWRLHKQTCRELDLRTQTRPTGGWRELCSLAAGSRILRAGSNGFIPEMSVEELTIQDHAQTRQRLLESFTYHLAPPGAAAGLFLLMGIHPVWGLRLAYASNQFENDSTNTMRFGERDESIFPQSTLEILQTAVFGTIACTVATLRKLDPQAAYNLDALANLINAAAQYCRRQAEAQLQRNKTSSLPVFLPLEFLTDGIQSQSHHRVVDFSTRGFIENIFIPAGALRRFDNGTFCIFEGSFDNINVANLDIHTQNNFLQRFLSDTHDQNQVA